LVFPDLGDPGRDIVTDRRPRWVYEAGEEPDARFSLANERTFLAWIRTSIALLAGGVALDAVGLGADRWLQTVLAITLVLLGLSCAATAWLRWARAERALRRGEPLPSTMLIAWFSMVLVFVAAGLVVLLL